MFVSTFCIFLLVLASKRACDFPSCEVGDDGYIWSTSKLQ